MSASGAGGVARSLRVAFAEALASLDLSARTQAALPARPPGEKGVVLIALGKCAATMTAGAVAAWGGSVRRAVLARPARARDFAPETLAALREAGARVEVFATGHPLPDEASVRAGRSALSAARAASRAGEFVLVLLSGGASAAACAPAAGLTLDEVRASWRALLASGAPIDVVNAARGRADRVKHGGLSRAAGSARMLTLAAADVLGDEGVQRATVGSGPTVGGAPAKGPREYVFVATPRDARRALEAALGRRGFSPVGALPDAAGEVDELARAYGLVLRGLAPGEARVAVGEPTVKLPAAPGRGGRAGRLALMVAREIRGFAGLGFLAGGTDGVDGESGHAGAVVDGGSWDALGEERGREALERFDDAGAHERLGTALDAGPTGINLLDLHALAREPG